MDRFIADLPSVPDTDLMLCPEHGIAYQADMSNLVPYDEAYFNKCLSYEDQEIAQKINAGRCALVARHHFEQVLDIGIGSGEFIKKRGPGTFGYDVNPVAKAWLKASGLWSERFEDFNAFTFWDVIEHVQTPSQYFQFMRPRSRLFTCLPIFQDVRDIRKSKHYRPNEHLYYWTHDGFVAWMWMHGFSLLESCDFEIEAGRDSIFSYAFVKGA